MKHSSKCLQTTTPAFWLRLFLGLGFVLMAGHIAQAASGQTIIDNQEIPGITGGAFDSHEESPGPIYLQGDHGGIAYRKIVLTPAAP